ncbi:hypothetical protein [Francisella tularensis]|uniref:hypothetical protein n=1 Tax=Francisella tularensis TaxID=263 RepID=UPI0018AD15F6|nr:hypothetical protein [Francisella tularensis]
MMAFLLDIITFLQISFSTNIFFYKYLFLQISFSTNIFRINYNNRCRCCWTYVCYISCKKSS